MLVSDENHTTGDIYNQLSYNNWADIKHLNNRPIIDRVDKDDNWIPYHIFRKFYVDLFIYIATIHACKTQLYIHLIINS